MGITAGRESSRRAARRASARYSPLMAASMASSPAAIPSAILPSRKCGATTWLRMEDEMASVRTPSSP